MPEDQQLTGGAGSGEGGAALDEQGANKPDSKPSNQDSKVDPKDLQRALDDLHKFKRLYHEEQRARTQAEEEAKSKQYAELKAKNMDKERADILEKRNQELESKTKKMQEAFENTQKYEALKAAAKLLGLRKEAEGDLDVVDTSGISVEYLGEKRFKVSGAELEAKKLLETRPHWFMENGAMKFNPGGATGVKDQPAKLSMKEIAALRWTKPDQYQAELQKYVEAKQKK